MRKTGLAKTSSGSLIYNSASSHDSLHLNNSPNTFSKTDNERNSKRSQFFLLCVYSELINNDRSKQ